MSKGLLIAALEKISRAISWRGFAFERKIQDNRGVPNIYKESLLQVVP